MRARLGLIAIAASLGVLVAPATGAAQSSLPGPDLPGRSSPSLQRADTTHAKMSRSKLSRTLGKLARRAPGASGFYVYDIGAAGKSVLFDADEGRNRRLASNTKLFTTAAALQEIGGTSRIETVVRRKGAVGSNGILNGSLYLVGGGDPSLGKSGMRELAREVDRTGIRKVKGDLVGDDTVFDRLRGVPDSGFGPSEYIAPLSGLVYGGSTYSGDPAKEAARAFQSQLRKRGVRVQGKVRVGKTPKSAARKPIAEFGSPSVASLIEQTNHVSDNFYAEMLAKGIAAAATGKQGTTKRGVKVAENFAKRQGSGFKGKDGSGLTANNRSSPRDVVRLLVAMRKHSDSRAYYDSLPKAGKEGTLGSRMQGTSAAGRCRGKTGTITGVSTLSGYCKAGHDLVAFSLLMNGVNDLGSAHNIQDEMVVAISKYRP